jgi:hypothetical protein
MQMGESRNQKRRNRLPAVSMPGHDCDEVGGCYTTAEVGALFGMTDSGTKSVIRRTKPIPGQAPAGDEENIPENLKAFPYIRVPHGLAGTRLHFPKKLVQDMYYKKQTPQAEIHQSGRLVTSLKDHTCPTCKDQMPAANAGAHYETNHKAFRCNTCKVIFRGTTAKEGHMGVHDE